MICEKGIASLMVERDSFDAIKLLDDKSGDGNCFKMLVCECVRGRTFFGHTGFGSFGHRGFL